jgi:hypothetical protein
MCCWLTGLALGAAMGATPGQSSLGGVHASVEQDRAHFSATMAPSTMQGGAHVETLQPTNGGIVREYSNADGVVFAVTWQGPSRPDLRQLLGDQYATASSVMTKRRGRRTARLMMVQRPDVVIRSQGHPGAFSGVAYDPRLIPAGFSVHDLQ